MSEPVLYLASASPRRSQLLRDAGIRFVQHAVPVDEDALTTRYSGPLERLGEYLAGRKAEAAVKDLREQGCIGMVLASDTTVLFNGRSLPKPRDGAEALAMLRELRGNEHVVATGVAVAEVATGSVRSATSLTRVRMREYSEEEMRNYIASGDPLDKAGAYSIQHPGFRPVASIAGCYLGVVGLPVCIVAALLGRGPLPPVAEAVTNAVDGEFCLWSARCQPPYPGPLHAEATDDEQPDQ